MVTTANPELSYRFVRALEHHRRGYVVVRDFIREELHRRRWSLRLPEHIEQAAAAILDRLLELGALALYQVGVNDANWCEHEQHQRQHAAGERDEQLRRVAEEARDDERRDAERRYQQRVAELESERYADRNRAKLEELERELAQRPRAVGKGG